MDNKCRVLYFNVGFAGRRSDGGIFSSDVIGYDILNSASWVPSPSPEYLDDIPLDQRADILIYISILSNIDKIVRLTQNEHSDPGNTAMNNGRENVIKIVT